MRRVHQNEESREELIPDLDEIARQGARRMLAEALEAEVQDYLEAARDQRDGRGHALATPWWCAMVTQESGKFSWEPERLRSVLRESTIAGWTRTATARDSRA